MEDQILEIKKLYENGIDFNLFEKLVLHSTDDHITGPSEYKNDLNIDSWKELYSEKNVEIPVSNGQLTFFFDYMSKYFSKYCTRNHDRYSIVKTLSDDRKSIELFKFEEIVFTVIQLLNN